MSGHAKGGRKAHEDRVALESGREATETAMNLSDPKSLPFLLTAEEAARVLRTTRKAIYARAERALLPGVIRDGRRVLIDRDELLRWLEERRAPSPGGSRR